MNELFGNQIIGSVFFTIVAFGSAYVILGARSLRHMLICAAIISAPWAGGLWIPQIEIDIRLSNIFILLAFIHSLTYTPLKSKTLHEKYLITIPFIIFVIWSAVCSYHAINPNRAFGGVFTFLLDIIYFVTIIRVVKSSHDFTLVIHSLFLGVFYTAVLGLIQYKVPFFSLGFIDRGYTTFMYWRARSTFYHANQYGFYQILILPVIFRYVIIMYGMKKMKRTRLFGALFLLVLFALYITSNRGSWLGFSIALVVTILWDFLHSSTKRNRRILLRTTAILTVVILVASLRYGGRVYNRFYGESKGNASNQAEARAELNEDAYRIIKEYPVFGVGIWNFQYHSTQVIFSHNLYLLVLSQVGYPGLVFFLLPILGCLIIGVRLKIMKNSHVSNLGSALLAVVIGMLIASYPGPDYWQSGQVGSHLWIVAAIVISFHHVYQNYLNNNRKKSRSKLNNSNKTTENLGSMVTDRVGNVHL